MASSSSSNIENASTSKKNNNPKGKNQYQGRPGRDDPYVEELLKKYHREGVTDRRELSKRFLSDHGIIMSEQTVARRKRQLGLHSSRLTTLKLSEDEKRQLILDQMSKDPKGRIGARTVKKGIFEDTGVNLTRDYIIEAMRTLDPQAYDARSPHHAKEKRKKKLLKEARQGSLSNGPGGDDHSGAATAQHQDDPGPSSNGPGHDIQVPSTSLEVDQDMESTSSQRSGPSPPRDLDYEDRDPIGNHPDQGSSSRVEPPRTIHLTERPQRTQIATQFPRNAQLQLSSSVAGSPARPRASTNTSTSTQPSSHTTTSLSQPHPSSSAHSHPSSSAHSHPSSSAHSHPSSSAHSHPSSSAHSHPSSSAHSHPSSSAHSHPSSQPQPTSTTSPSPTSILTSLRETTPLLTSLTRFLQTQDPSSLSGDEAREVLGEAMKCMEAAALLERQIARFAGGVKGSLGGS